MSFRGERRLPVAQCHIAQTVTVLPGSATGASALGFWPLPYHSVFHSTTRVLFWKCERHGQVHLYLQVRYISTFKFCHVSFTFCGQCPTGTAGRSWSNPSTCAPHLSSSLYSSANIFLPFLESCPPPSCPGKTPLVSWEFVVYQSLFHVAQLFFSVESLQSAWMFSWNFGQFPVVSYLGYLTNIPLSCHINVSRARDTFLFICPSLNT